MSIPETTAEARARILATAKRMLAGECSYVEGSRLISGLALEAGVDRHAEPFMTFVAIESQTDHIPIGNVLELWQAEARAKSAPEWDQLEAWAREDGEAACHEVIAKLSMDTSGESPAG